MAGQASTVPVVAASIGAVARRTALGLVVQAGTRPFLNSRVPIPVRRRALSLAGRLTSPVPKGVEVARLTLGGVPTWRLRPEDADPGRAVLALHGGGYNYGDLGTHGGAFGWLARSLGTTVWMPDYRLAPEHPFPAALDDAVAAWSALVSDGTVAAITGDSAGGHLALSLACEVRDRGLGAPAALALHSPWVDADPARAWERPEDRILHRALMARDAAVFVDGRDPADPLLSPINRDLAGLPPTMVQWGAGEGLHEDAEDLVAALEAAGGRVEGRAYPDLWHDAMLHVPALREAREWLDDTTAFLAGHLG